MALTRVTKGGITDDAVDGDKLKDGSITTAKIGASAVESSEINDGTVGADDLASSLNISSKTVTLPNTSVTAAQLSNTLDLSSKTVTLSNTTIENLKRPVQDNIALLGFKMAVNDGLTVFNLVDGIVDEFHDESGTDEAEGSNDLYCASNDHYVNSTQPQGVSNCASYSAGFTTTSVTEADTSAAGANPAAGRGLYGSFTVPTGMTSLNAYVWGAGAGTQRSSNEAAGGGGGFAEGTLAVSGSQVIQVVVGEGGPVTEISLGPHGINVGGLGGYNPFSQASPGVNDGKPASDVTRYNTGGGNANPNSGAGGGLSGLFAANPVSPQYHNLTAPLAAYLVAGSGGGGAFGPYGGTGGGAGGGQTGGDGASYPGNPRAAEGGTQSAGGVGGGCHSSRGQGQGGGKYYGGSASGALAGCNPNNDSGGGGAGYYGGGGNSTDDSGAGGSSYFGHPQITSGSTEDGQAGGAEGSFGGEGGGVTSPFYVACTNEALHGGPTAGEDGYVLLTGCVSLPASTTSTTIVSNAFTSTTVPTSSRIVVFEENVDTPTLNTDVIASISRDGGSTFTNATLSDSGYVTGSSGQRILTGTATISGQPSGQSMRWKLALANNTVKIHGVALQWS